jgi:hypothetical protein
MSKVNLTMEDDKMKSLQELFVESRGAAVIVNGCSVVQMLRVPMNRGRVTIRFLGQPTTTNGVVLKCAAGGIKLSDGRRVKSVKVWDDPNLPRDVVHEVECLDGELRIWNVYRVEHKNGVFSEDSWTGNSGMVIVHNESGVLRCCCSSGLGAFDPSEFVFEVLIS